MEATKTTKDARDWTMEDLRALKPSERRKWAESRGKQLGREAKSFGASYAVRLLSLLIEFDSTFDEISRSKSEYRTLVKSFRDGYLAGYDS